MSIVYSLITILLVVGFILIKKSDTKQNVLFWIVLSLVLLLGYNVLVCGLLSLVHITNNLLVLSIINLIIVGFIGFKIYRKKEIQKYYIRLKDGICLGIILISVFSIGMIRFQNPMSIKYETTDPATHFSAAKDFYNRNGMPDIEAEMMMPGAYTNTGIGMLMASDFMTEENFHVVYILFDLYILFLLGAMFYIGIVNEVESKTKSIITLLFSLLFIFGYPLNSMIFGFAYLSVGLLFIISLLVSARFVKNKELNMITYCLIFFTLNFGLFFSYYLFVPVVYVAFGLYMLFDMLKNRKTKKIFSFITKENIIKTVFALILPTILGFAYFVLPGLIASGKTIVSYITAEGYIYRDLYSNFILLIPLALFYIIYNVKNKKNSFSTILAIVTIIFTLYLFKKGLRGETSSYYYYKMYFIMWVIVLYLVTKASYKIVDKELSLYIFGYLFIYITIIVLSVCGFDTKISETNFLFNPTNYLKAYSDIYVFNIEKLKEKNSIYSYNQIQVIQELIKKVDNKKEIQITGNALQLLWAKDLYCITDTDDIHELILKTDVDQAIQEFINNNEKKYLIYFDTTKEVEKQTDNYKAIIDTEDIVVLEKNN